MNGPAAMPSRYAAERDNRQMFASALEPDTEFEPDAGPAFDEHLRFRTRRAARPTRSWLEAYSAVSPTGVVQPRHADPRAGALSAVNRKGSVSHRPPKWSVFALTGRVSFAFATFAFDPHRMSLEPRKSLRHKSLACSQNREWL